ncbi:hypothetical protein LXM50_10100 [Microbacterium sp. Au-Mic1]|uniref:hypothetical protein n=1 Tax=Microbacterium sp. Au-Mic1 TaxID=2906457 RepID=UPI001E3E268E|nr:hypothetical protein [Microbacterium sp. Au-Mic1]MCE4026321.1 hypothetical protein [Microbacterium sp. Au-Mic1]
MSRVAKVATGVGAAAVVAGLVVLAYPAFATLGGIGRPAAAAAASARPRSTPVATASPTPSPDGCTAEASYNLMGDAAHLLKADAIQDRGSRPGARGDIVTHADGVYAYVVAPNDNLFAIEDRLCFDQWTLARFNHVVGIAIQPSAQLIVRPDPTLPWIDSYHPYDEVPGVSNADYTDGLAAIGAAVRTQDLDTARTIWNRLVSGHVSPAAEAAATKAFDDSDWAVLDQLFP